jgi:hypothetical protein
MTGWKDELRWFLEFKANNGKKLIETAYEAALVKYLFNEQLGFGKKLDVQRFIAEKMVSTASGKRIKKTFAADIVLHPYKTEKVLIEVKKGTTINKKTLAEAYKQAARYMNSLHKQSSRFRYGLVVYNEYMYLFERQEGRIIKPLLRINVFSSSAKVLNRLKEPSIINFFKNLSGLHTQLKKEKDLDKLSKGLIGSDIVEMLERVSGHLITSNADREALNEIYSGAVSIKENVLPICTTFRYNRKL